MDIEKALDALKSPKNVKFKDLLKICEEFFEIRNIKGSHHSFKTPWKGKPWINIQKDGPKAKKYQVEQVREALLKLKGILEENDGKNK
ncbi:MAG: toxin HicA [Halobacteriovoraceae bacterium]|nr:toxin HicA [Halobacteriovoraceae bacterium]